MSEFVSVAVVRTDNDWQSSKTISVPTIPREGDLIRSPWTANATVRVVSVVLESGAAPQGAMATVYTADGELDARSGAFEEKTPRMSRKERALLFQVVLGRLEHAFIANQLMKLAAKLGVQKDADLEALPMSIRSLDGELDILLSGYEGLYSELFEQFSEPISATVCEFVLDVMSMYDAMIHCTDKTLASHPNACWLEFPGFDGNDEACHLAIANFVRDKQRRFTRLEIPTAHHATLSTYEKMLRVWKALPNRYQLRPEGVRQILDATS